MIDECFPLISFEKWLESHEIAHKIVWIHHMPYLYVSNGRQGIGQGSCEKALKSTKQTVCYLWRRRITEFRSQKTCSKACKFEWIKFLFLAINNNHFIFSTTEPICCAICVEKRSFSPIIWQSIVNLISTIDPNNVHTARKHSNGNAGSRNTWKHT